MHRPHYHFTPPAHWMNDPNGLVYSDGEYHLFYQHHPGSTVWGPMHWGHAVSRDLIHWRHLPIALYPDEHGMIFSGSAVVDWNNTAGFGERALVIIFTYNKDHQESQNLAYSLDQGRTWTKNSGNPVIPPSEGLRDFRDPKVFWHEDHWVMVLAAGKAILFYGSRDLIHWEQSGRFGDDIDLADAIWETPDLFPLPLEDGSGTRWVLTVALSNGAPAGGSGTRYYIGEFDGRRFTSENPQDVILWADYGADFYAPQSWNHEPNGRRLMLGWMNNWQYSTRVPAAGWRGMFSVVRELTLRHTDSGIRLVQSPIPEMKGLRGKQYHWRQEIIQPGTNLLSEIRDQSLEIIAEFQITEQSRDFGFRVRVGQNEQTTIRYQVKEKKLLVDRTRSGHVDFADTFARAHSVYLSPSNDLIRLHLYVDSSSVEIFANDGFVVFSETIFPEEQSQGLDLFSEGGSVVLSSLDLYHLNSVLFQTLEK